MRGLRYVSGLSQPSRATTLSEISFAAMIMRRHVRSKLRA
jgi:hypothetical protein